MIEAEIKLAAAETDSEILNWLLRQPAVKAQAYFWNYSSRRERKKAMQKDMKEQP